MQSLKPWESFFSFVSHKNSLICLVPWIFCLCMFLTTDIGHLDSSVSLSFIDLPNVDTLCYTILKNCICGGCRCRSVIEHLPSIPEAWVQSTTLQKSNKKLNLLISSLVSSLNSLNIDKLWSSWWQIQVFQNFNFCLKAQILPLRTNTIKYFLWSDRFGCRFLREHLPNTKVKVVFHDRRR